MRRGPGRRWLVAGGLIAVAVSRRAAAGSLASLRAVLRRAIPGADATAPFREAPCEGVPAAAGEGLRVEDVT